MIGTQRREQERAVDLRIVIWRSVKSLSPHPLNTKIYGEFKPDAELLESITKNGVINPVIVDRQSQIISGHRRWLAAKEVGIDKIPALRFDGTDTEAEEMLIEANRQRVKTKGQIARETTELFRIEKILAKERMATRKQDGDDLGKTTKVVAAKTGQGHNTVEQQVAIVTRAEEGDGKAQEALAKLDTGSISFAAAYRMIGDRSSDVPQTLARTSLGGYVSCLERMSAKIPAAVLAHSDKRERTAALKRIAKSVVDLITFLESNTDGQAA